MLISQTDRLYECIKYCNYNICIFVTVGATIIERIIENQNHSSQVEVRHEYVRTFL